MSCRRCFGGMRIQMSNAVRASPTKPAFRVSMRPDAESCEDDPLVASAMAVLALLVPAAIVALIITILMAGTARLVFLR